MKAASMELRKPFDYRWNPEEPYEAMIAMVRLPYSGELAFFGNLCQESQMQRWAQDASEICEVVETFATDSTFKSLYEHPDYGKKRAQLHLPFTLDTVILYDWRRKTGQERGCPPFLREWRRPGNPL